MSKPNSNVTVCVRFRPLSHKERKGNDDKVCFKKLDSESFVFKVWMILICLYFCDTWHVDECSCSVPSL
jgi:hypothetical protein